MSASGDYAGCGGINGLGQVVGWEVTPDFSTTYGFVDDVEDGDPSDSANFTNVPLPDGVTLEFAGAMGINNNGLIVGSMYDQSQPPAQGFLVNSSQFITLPDPLGSGNDFYLYGINDDVQMVGSGDSAVDDVILGGLPTQ